MATVANEPQEIFNLIKNSGYEKNNCFLFLDDWFFL